MNNFFNQAFKSIFITMLVLTTASFCVAKDDISNEEAMDFFELYQKMIESRSTTVVQLISENALLHSKTITVANTQLVEVYDVENVYRFINAVQAYIHHNKEESEFEKVTIVRENGQLKIKAERFSNTHCYLDKGYYLVLERERSFIKVVEEKITIINGTSCEELEDIEINIQ